MDLEIRLSKHLADCGVAARRKADALITSGRVRVNGRVPELGVKVDPAKDRITMDGKPVAATMGRITVMLNKPSGVVTTAKDPEGRTTVLDLLPRKGPRLFPVGRLDYMSEGMLLLTNDGALSQKLAHPSLGVQKEYVVTIGPRVSDITLERLTNGVYAGELGMIRPERVIRVSSRKVRITLTEGRRREIRTMCATLRLTVEKLKRVRIGGLALGSLEPGEWRVLEPRDLTRLFARPRPIPTRAPSTRTASSRTEPPRRRRPALKGKRAPGMPRPRGPGRS